MTVHEWELTIIIIKGKGREQNIKNVEGRKKKIIRKTSKIATSGKNCGEQVVSSPLAGIME